MSEVRGSGPGCQAATAQEPLRGANPYPRSEVVEGRSNRMSKEWWLRGAQECREELIHIQGQEGQW